MQFQKQQYQTDCVSNIMQVLNECDVRTNDFSTIPMFIDTLWQQNSYTQCKKSDRNRLDVLMETGTGKTFTYLKTIFEIHKNFSKKKFIIVVPRTAIKLGVIQNIKLTKDYFFHEYGKYLQYIDYPKDGLGKIQHDFLHTSDLVVLITTNSAFNSEKNKINQTIETLFENGSVWQGIRAKNPIIIIDEPHLLKGTETQKGLDTLKNALQIRFGATFPSEKKDKEHTLSNVVYRLDSISAFREYLVKGITVHTLISDEEQSGLTLSDTESQKKAFTVIYDINHVIYRKKIHTGQDIGSLTGMKNYNGVSATKVTQEKVFLSNGGTLELSKGGYTLGDEEILAMVETTIDKHFTKEEALFNKGIKSLSLFFIPRVDDFRENEHNANPRIKSIFEEAYKKKRQEIIEATNNQAYKKYLAQDFDEDGILKVHEGYFSGDTVSTKEKKAGLNKDDVGINIILNEKEKLLSFDTPLRFIFSVWALQEGWDNQNIFTICKLSDNHKDTSRRQQVGRGLRIAINQKGIRQTYTQLDEKESDFYEINTLDMVVSGREKEFIAQIQQEIQEASFSFVGNTLGLDELKNLGFNDNERSLLYLTLMNNKVIDDIGTILSSVYDFIKNNRDKIYIPNLTDERYKEILKIFTDNRNPIKDGNKPSKKVKIRQDKWKEFQELWETINKKSKIIYKNIEEENIIEKVAEQFNSEHIPPIQSKIYTQKYNAQKDTIETWEEQTQGEMHFFQTQKLEEWLNVFIKEEKFSFQFVLKLLNMIDTQKIKNNPKKAKERLIEILKETIHGAVISSVSYQFLETSIYPNELQNKKGHEKSEIDYGILGKDYVKEQVPEHLLYDTICFDSDIEKEIQQSDPEQVNENKVTVFAKLPKISIPTPYKHYNPDFAYLIEKTDGKKLFLVVEAKGYKNESNIPPQEQQKIKYAKKFFKDLQEELPNNIDIQYETRINEQDLSDILLQ